MNKETGTCDDCGLNCDIELIVLCPECEQSNQLCLNCLELDYVYCRECDHVLDTV